MGRKEFFSVIIAGGRTFSDYTLLEKKCDAFFANKQPTSIVCGGAKGADMLGKRYADEHDIAVEMYPADWGKNGKRAGYIRNWEMLQTADALVAFWDGESKGTKHMIEIAKEAGIPVRVVRY